MSPAKSLINQLRRTACPAVFGFDDMPTIAKDPGRIIRRNTASRAAPRPPAGMRAPLCSTTGPDLPGLLRRVPSNGADQQKVHYWRAARSPHGTMPDRRRRTGARRVLRGTALGRMAEPAYLASLLDCASASPEQSLASSGCPTLFAWSMVFSAASPCSTWTGSWCATRIRIATSCSRSRAPTRNLPCGDAFAPLTEANAVLINAWEPHAYVHDPRRPRTMILALYIEPSWLKTFRPNWAASGAPGFFDCVDRRIVAAYSQAAVTILPLRW